MMYPLLQVIFVFLFVIHSGFSAPYNASDAHVELKNECGKLSGSRIIEGEVAAVGAFPHMASIRLKSTQKHYCGGSIILDSWVLTAAHCFPDLSANEIYVVVGTNTLDKGGVVHEVSHLINHPQFSMEEGIVNDIALIKVSKPFQFGQLVAPIPLTRDNLDVSGYPVTLSGWGVYVKNIYEFPNDLQYLNTCMIDRQNCFDIAMAWNQYNVTDIDKKICTFTRYGQGLCSGDSGSALLANGSQIGIASYVMNNCADGFPDFYTSVFSFTDWIDSVVHKYS